MARVVCQFLMAEIETCNTCATPKKPVPAIHQCVLCGNALENSRKRVKLTPGLLAKVHEIVASENLDPAGYICNNTCYKASIKYFELKNGLNDLKKKITENFEKKKEGLQSVPESTVRWKRQLPTDLNENTSQVPKISCRQSLLLRFPSGPIIHNQEQLSHSIAKPTPLKQNVVLSTVPVLPTVALNPENSAGLTSAVADFKENEDSPVGKVEAEELCFHFLHLW